MGIKHWITVLSKSFLAFRKLYLGGQVNSSEFPIFHTLTCRHNLAQLSTEIRI